MADKETGDVKGSSSSGSGGGGKNISALLKKLKGKINKKTSGSEQPNLMAGANSGKAPPGIPGAGGVTTFSGPASTPNSPFVGQKAEDYLVKGQLKGFSFGNIDMSNLGSMTGFPSAGDGGIKPMSLPGVEGIDPNIPTMPGFTKKEDE